ncbi:hypothetical protein CDD81_26 [Ophiocordyceps australis]|uniref:Phospholipase D n=1 Tax=Ophiocordyceps australis TaxID=1399860 RepID=A0A2C5YI78_9HYPO|nr:hypothetical protein CDD81_26 [Ophiocordyceps australis]
MKLPFVVWSFLAANVALAQVAESHTRRLSSAGVTENTGNGSTRLEPRSLGAKPFYAVAHRVLTSSGVQAAVHHGANALEIDIQGWKKGAFVKTWDLWADHDGSLSSAGDKVRDVFDTIAQERQRGANIAFVWLDIKNPDYCDEDADGWEYGCSILRLVNLARFFLQPLGVRVLYDFSTSRGRDYEKVRAMLNKNEAMGIAVRWEERSKLDSLGPRNKSQRIFSAGFFNWSFKYDSVKREIREAIDSQAFGKVFGWTLTAGQTDNANAMMAHTAIDGLIYGRAALSYDSTWSSYGGIEIIKSYLKRRPHERFLATARDSPW